MLELYYVVFQRYAYEAVQQERTYFVAEDSILPKGYGQFFLLEIFPLC